MMKSNPRNSPSPRDANPRVKTAYAESVKSSLFDIENSRLKESIGILSEVVSGLYERLTPILQPDLDKPDLDKPENEVDYGCEVLACPAVEALRRVNTRTRAITDVVNRLLEHLQI